MKTSKLEIDITDWDIMTSSSTSKGNQQKYTNGSSWIKLDYFGFEGEAEEFVSKLLDVSSLSKNSYVSYRSCEVFSNGVHLGSGCVSDNFLKEDEELITLDRLLEVHGISTESLIRIRDTDERIKLVSDTLLQNYKIDCLDYFQTLATLDSIILNEDRHLYNIAFIYDSNKHLRPSPIFDNGLSLLSDTTNYSYMTPKDILYRKVKCRPFSAKFKSQYDALGGNNFFIDKSKLLELIDAYDNERIKYVIEKSMRLYPEVFI